MTIIDFLIIFVGALNLIRMGFFLIGNNFYDLKFSQKHGKKFKKNTPVFSVVIPAHNEQSTVLRAIESVFRSDYPKEKLRVIVVDDGSTDKTPKIVLRYKKLNRQLHLTLVSQPNLGKATALNNGIKNFVKGELVMCLDADSYLEKEAIGKAVSYFQDPTVCALAAKVKIIPDDTMLNLIQRFEYLICYQMKKAQTVFNIEYIIGGIGSTFRVSTLKNVDYYDTNTVTEDIDLTMKILNKGSKKFRAIYGADVVAHTESVLSVGGLIKQRYRWKWGRCQTFLKRKNMFFDPNSKHAWSLTCFYLPYAIFCDLLFLLEPVFILYIAQIVILYGDLITFFSALAVISAYLMVNVASEETLSTKEKILFCLISPTMYLFFYLLSYVEYLALIKTLLNLNKLKSSLGERYSWEHVARANYGFLPS